MLYYCRCGCCGCASARHPHNQLAWQISNCSTHAVSCVERAAAHGSAMSVWKNMPSAHSEWPKMSIRVQDEGGKERGVPRRWRPHEVNVLCWSIFMNTCRGFSCSSIHSSATFTLFGGWNRLSGMLFLYGTYMVHDVTRG